MNAKKLKCRRKKCGYVWWYTGKAKFFTCCPICKNSNVNINEHKLEEKDIEVVKKILLAKDAKKMIKNINHKLLKIKEDLKKTGYKYEVDNNISIAIDSLDNVVGSLVEE